MDQLEQIDCYDRGMRELLSSLSGQLLDGILSAATGGLVRYGSVPLDEDGQPMMDDKTHAINSILMYSDALSLLNKQRMRKAYLAGYLNQKQVKMTIPATKNSLCRDVLNYWGRQMPESVRVVEDEPLRRAGANQQSHHPPPPPVEPVITNLSQLSSPQIPQPQTTFGPVPEGNSAVFATHAANGLVPTHDEVMEHETGISLRQKEAQLGQQLGREFSLWFYERLNSLTDFSATHFWPECNFRLEMIFSSQPDHTLIEETPNNGEACCAKIKDLVAVKQLYFNPNTLGSGIRGYLNPHGLAQVMVCGTIHLRDNGAPVGIFEQMFGLMKDPTLGNNYKIKFSVMRLREGAQLALQDRPPELLDSTLVGIIEEIDDD